MRRPASPMARESQAGVTLIELALSVVIGAMLIASTTYLFKSQVRGYKDIGSQARLQSATKGAMQTMNTEIANTGACLNNKRFRFTMDPNQLKFAYKDLKARHCPVDDTVTVEYFVKAGGAKGDTLIERLTCNSNDPVTKPLIKGFGAVTIALSYYDLNGIATATASKVKAVEISLDVKSGGKSLYAQNRNPKLRVELLN